MSGAVREAYNELAAGAGPALVGLPDVDILTTGGIVRQTATPSRHGLFNVRQGSRAIAGHLLSDGIACGQDGQTQVAA